jgi:hypothetical protein
LQSDGRHHSPSFLSLSLLYFPIRGSTTGLLFCFGVVPELSPQYPEMLGSHSPHRVV